MLASGRNFAVADERIDAGARVSCQERDDDVRQAFVLRLGIGTRDVALQLDADAVIVAPDTSTPMRLTGMPGALIKRNKLVYIATSIDQEMRGNPKTFQICQAGVCAAIQFTAEQRPRMPRAVFSFWQRHAVHHDEIGFEPRRARIEVRGRPPVSACQAMLTGNDQRRCRHGDIVCRTRRQNQRLSPVFSTRPFR